MTKTIILVQGPDDGREEAIPVENKQFIVSHPRPVKKRVLLSMRRGVYKQTGEKDMKNREMFLWWGWE